MYVDALNIPVGRVHNTTASFVEDVVNVDADAPGEVITRCHVDAELPQEAGDGRWTREYVTRHRSFSVAPSIVKFQQSLSVCYLYRWLMRWTISYQFQNDSVQSCPVLLYTVNRKSPFFIKKTSKFSPIGTLWLFFRLIRLSGFCVCSFHWFFALVIRRPLFAIAILSVHLSRWWFTP